MVLRHTHLRISGMTCGACVHRVEQALYAVNGVAKAVVNLLSESASVESDGDRVADDKLLSAVRAAGYEAEVLSLEALQGDPLGPDTDTNSRREQRALWIGLALALPVVALEYLWPMAPTAASDFPLSCRGLQAALSVSLAASPAGAPILAGGLRALRHRTANMDVLITMGVVAALTSSLYGTAAHLDEFVHFHAAAMILVLVTTGRYLEGRAKGRAAQAMAALARRAPKTALVRRDEALVSVPVEEISVGDIVSVPVHCTIPTDSEVVEGAAAVDESLMTGEAMPVRRGTGDSVLAGTMVTEGGLVLRATAIGDRSALGRIAQLVAQAQTTRTHMQRLADRAAAIFTPIVLGAATVTFVGWLAFGGHAMLASAARSAIAVLVVACPCALGLATPTVVLVASGLAALRGILVRDAAMLEAMGRVEVVVWDKTGTLTSGTPAVRSVLPLNGYDQQTVLRLAAGAELLSAHPAAKAIVAQARREGIQPPEPTGFESVPGSGVAAELEGMRIVVGSRRFARGGGVDLDAVPAAVETVRREGDMIAIVAANDRAIGIITLSDPIRPSARSAIRRIQKLGVRSQMLTGDEEAAARAVAEQVGIDEVVAGVDPAGKVDRIRELKHRSWVAMVGDGVNDAAALAAADVGIAFATGADVAGEAAGINLIGSTPQLVADAVELARASLRIIRQNLFWAFFYNVLMIPLAAAGILPPAVAAGAMTVSSLTVVLNALRLPRAAMWAKAREGERESR